MANQKTGNPFFNFIASGKTGGLDESLRYIVFNFALMAGGTFLVVFGFAVLREGNSFRALADIAVGIMCFVTMALLRTKLPLYGPGGVVIALFGILCVILVYSGDLHGIAGLWIFSFPLIAIFILGLQMGLVYTLLAFCGMTIFTLIPGLAARSYNIDSASRFFGLYFLVTLLSVIYEQTRLSKDRQVEGLNHELRVERDVITAMKDNLNLGIFLMNKDGEIQGAYSKPLETILGGGEIEGKKLTGFLSSSLTEKERETLEDYFKMVLTRQFDTKMLEDINPISEFTYVNSSTGNSKILRTVFSTVDQGLNDYYVLGSMEDISAAKELQWQLEAEAGKREDEMKALFQVIQVDPAVFGDFIEDTEYEFERINEILKDKRLSAKEAMVDIYQSVHAIKSNAVILGLDNFSGKLHELENTIKQYRDGGEVSFDNVLHVAVELERIMKEKDRFRAIIERIEAFQSAAGGKRRQDRYVLVETLTNACEKAARNGEKEVTFTIDELEGSILEHGPRRVIKEVLTQLVRNAVYHGIETPREREAAGKENPAKVRLSMTKENNRIHLRLSDDGRGIDFGKIREKALAKKLLSKAEAADTNRLLKVIFYPGFSTAALADVTAGRGIGLNLVKERVKELRGSIKLSSDPGKGTVFHVYLPLEEQRESKAPGA